MSPTATHPLADTTPGTPAGAGSSDGDAPRTRRALLCGAPATCRIALARIGAARPTDPAALTSPRDVTR